MMALRAGLVLAGFLILTLALMPVQLVLRFVWPRAAQHFPHLYHRVLARWLGLKVTVSGDAPRAGGALLVSNHVSWLDIVVLSAALPVCFIAKHEVRSWPLFGWMARLQDTVFVDRTRRRKTSDVRDAIVARLNRGDTLVLFAEGTSHDGVNMLPFKSALLSAVEVPGVPVVPITLAYTTHWHLPMTRRQRPFYAWYGDMELAPHLWDAMSYGPLGVTVHIHPALPPSQHRKDLAKRAEVEVRTRLALALQGHVGESPQRFTPPPK
jgi:lyso-ornithine lipid O-acyltransferase